VRRVRVRGGGGKDVLARGGLKEGRQDGRARRGVLLGERGPERARVEPREGIRHRGRLAPPLEKGLLPELRGPRFSGGDEARAQEHAHGAQGEGRYKAAAVGEP